MRICVLGSSSAKTSKSITDESYQLGKILAEKNIICVNGGGKTGVMGSVNDACLDHNGKTIGVIHEMFCFDGEESQNLSKVVVVNGGDLHARKRKLFVLSDALIFMPGGAGTFDELWDAISARSLRLRMMCVEKRDSIDVYKSDTSLGLDRVEDFKRKPIVVVNIDGFYDTVLKTFEQMNKHNVLYSKIEDYYHVVSTAEEAVEYCINELKKFDIHPGTSNDDVIVDQDITEVRLKHHKELKIHKINLRDPVPSQESSCSITDFFKCPGTGAQGTCPFTSFLKLSIPFIFGAAGYYIGRKYK